IAINGNKNKHGEQVRTDAGTRLDPTPDDLMRAGGSAIPASKAHTIESIRYSCALSASCNGLIQFAYHTVCGCPPSMAAPGRPDQFCCASGPSVSAARAATAAYHPLSWVKTKIEYVNTFMCRKFRQKHG